MARNTQNSNLKEMDGILSSYMEAIDRIPLMDYEEEYETAMKAKNGDKKARERLINSNLRFVVSIAMKFRGQGLPLSDLIDEGNIGLAVAADKFDPEKGYHFISYAVWWIRQSIMKAISEQARPVRLPLNKGNELILINRAKTALEKENGGKMPGIEDIARVSGLPEESVKELLEVTRDFLSFDAPVSEDEDDSADYFNFYEDKDQRVEDSIMESSMNEDVRSLLSVLTEKERFVITKRFGLDGEESMSLKAIGDIYGQTKERIRQIEKGALDKLRRVAEEKGMESYRLAV